MLYEDCTRPFDACVDATHACMAAKKVGLFNAWAGLLLSCLEAPFAMYALRLPCQATHDLNEAVRKVQGIRGMLAPGDNQVS
jgi:hypothetical protein